MVKYYCDSCGKELSKENRYRADMRISGFVGIADSIKTEFCEECLGKIIGAENFAEILRRKAERQKRKEERNKGVTDNAD